MARFPLFPLVTTALGAAILLPVMPAQSAPAPSPILSPAKNGGSPAPSNAAPAPKRSRAISPEAAAALAAASPKYTPPAPKPPPKSEEEQPDLRDVDKPKNEIIRLPKYLVREPKPAVLQERDVLTDKGLTDVAMRRYISEADRALNRWTLPLFGSSKEARARAMLAEDDRLRHMSDLENSAQDAGKTDGAAGSFIRKESQQTFLRSADFGWSGGGPK